MADRSLTYEEFQKLSVSDKLNAYQYLSDNDKLKVRICTPSAEKTFIPCNRCAYRIKETFKCKAFPEGILSDHIRTLIVKADTSCGDNYKFIPREGI